MSEEEHICQLHGPHLAYQPRLLRSNMCCSFAMANQEENFHMDMNKTKGRKAKVSQGTCGSLEKSSEGNGELGYGGPAEH